MKNRIRYVVLYYQNGK